MTILMGIFLLFMLAAVAASYQKTDGLIAQFQRVGIFLVKPNTALGLFESMTERIFSIISFKEELESSLRELELQANTLHEGLYNLDIEQKLILRAAAREAVRLNTWASTIRSCELHALSARFLQQRTFTAHDETWDRTLHALELLSTIHRAATEHWEEVAALSKAT